MGVDVIVIGAGAAGLLAAAQAAKRGKRVLLLDKNERAGRKLLITGKGRCNLTNNCDQDTFMQNIPSNPRFLYSALSAFTPQDTMAFFEQIGVPLKTERGNRVFPQSDKAVDVVDALVAHVKSAGCKLIAGTVTSLLTADGAVTGVSCADGRTFSAPAVILCTGGKSYPLTGSTGEGYVLAKAVGHTVTPLKPSLVPLEITERFCADLMGLSLRNVTLTLLDTQRNTVLYTELGELLFTHFGVSGPLVLSASSHIRDMVRDRYAIELDLKPALDDAKLDARVQRDFAEYQNRDFANALGKLLPATLIPVMVSLSGIDGSVKVNQITREQRMTLCRLLKHFRLTVKGFRPIEEAIITSGGIAVREINPKTMESKLLRGLYFAGEVIDVDAYTGGFNLQIAFSTGFAAGTSI